MCCYILIEILKAGFDQHASLIGSLSHPVHDSLKKHLLYRGGTASLGPRLAHPKSFHCRDFVRGNLLQTATGEH